MLLFITPYFGHVCTNRFIILAGLNIEVNVWNSLYHRARMLAKMNLYLAILESVLFCLT